MTSGNSGEHGSLWARRRERPAHPGSVQLQLPKVLEPVESGVAPRMCALKADDAEVPSLWARRQQGGNNPVCLQVPEPVGALKADTAEVPSLWARRKQGGSSPVCLQAPEPIAHVLEVNDAEVPSLWAWRQGGNSVVQLHAPSAVRPNDESERNSLWARRKGSAVPEGLQLQTGRVNPFCRRFDTSASYQVVGTVGEGAKSFVQKAVRQSDNLQVALKTKMILTEESQRAEYLIEKEFKILRRMQHPKIVGAIDFMIHPTCTVLVMDYFDGIDLDKRVKSQPEKRFSREVARKLTHLLCEAISYMHSVDVMHRDIKPENILISEDLDDLRLLDFDAAHCMAESTSLTPAGTPLYAAPELLEGDPSTASSDIWGVGLCLYIMLTGALPKRRSSHPHFWKPIILEGPKWEAVSDKGRRFLRDTLEFDPEKRPLASQLPKYDWLEGLPGLARAEWPSPTKKLDNCTQEVRSTSRSSTRTMSKCSPLDLPCAWAGDKWTPLFESSC